MRSSVPRLVVVIILSAFALPMAQSFGIDSSSSDPVMGTQYQLRPFDPTQESDRASLEFICKNVYGGSDYLPQTAASYVADPACSFLALTNVNEEDSILAVANYKRLPAQRSAWIEAVRTHPEYRNQGLATTLLRSLVDVAIKENEEEDAKNEPPTNILTCTIQSNKGMLRAFEKVGFVQSNTIPTLSWTEIKALPGWTPECDKTPEPLLDALNLKHLVSPIAKAVPSSAWSVISSEQELLERLQQSKLEGGCSGYLPGLYEYIVPGPNRIDLKQSFEHGLVLAMNNPKQKELSGCEVDQNTDDEGGNIGQAILVLTQDERISSLKSKWVCSIVAHTRQAFEAALWHAHSLDVAMRMKSFQRDEGIKDTIVDEELSAQAMPFFLVFDDAVPLAEGTLAHKLPRVTDECVVFSYQHE